MNKYMIEKCDMCGTPSYAVETAVPFNKSWAECTSGHGLHGGGSCCAPVGVKDMGFKKTYGHKYYITNAFSINMLNNSDVSNITFYPIGNISSCIDYCNTHLIESAVGHADTAALFSQLLGIDVPVNRATIELDQNTTLLVGQYKGPRLPEGTSVLPEGAVVEWWIVWHN